MELGINEHEENQKQNTQLSLSLVFVIKLYLKMLPYTA